MNGITDGIGKLGFGLMRLPKKENGAIDVEQVKKMVDTFMDAGFNYFDTAWAYPGSEEAIKQALIERYPRESFKLATKNAAWINCKTREDAIAQFENSLRVTGAGYIDFYLLHNLGGPRTHVFDDLKMWDFVKEQKEKGLIKHIGFSMHSTADELETILTAHPETEFVQLQINYADWEDGVIQSRKCLEVANKHKVPVSVMEPVKGGLLAKPPASVEMILKDADPNMSCVSWANAFAADCEGVFTVLSGMSSLEQTEENVRFMKNFKGLTESQKETIKKATAELKSLPIIPCTSCDYCAKVCPENVGISPLFSAMNLVTLYKDHDFAAEQVSWNVTMAGKKHAKDCIECGACEDACPQRIKIIDELKKVAIEFP